MPPLPTRKRSKSKKGTISSHLALRPARLSRCPRCRSAKLPHHVCPTCGYYAGRDVLGKESPPPERGQ